MTGELKIGDTVRMKNGLPSHSARLAHINPINGVCQIFYDQFGGIESHVSECLLEKVSDDVVISPILSDSLSAGGHRDE